MVKNSAVLLRQAKTLNGIRLVAQSDVYHNQAAKDHHVPSLTAARDAMNVIVEKFGLEIQLLDWNCYNGLCSQIENGYTRIRDAVSEDRRRKREAKIHEDRAAIDIMRPASAHIDRPIRSRRSYAFPPKPRVDTTPKAVPSHAISLDAALIAVRALVETLPDDTLLPESTLNASYIRLTRRRTPEDPAPVTDDEHRAARYGLFDYMPTRVVTVGDLKRMDHESLIALPRVGRRKAITELAKLARAHGLDASFATDPARVVPVQPADRVLHALAMGLTVAQVKHDSHTGRSHRCLRAYELRDGELVETARTAAYNETDGHVVGMGNVTWRKDDLVTWSKIGDVTIAKLTDKGSARVAELLFA